MRHYLQHYAEPEVKSLAAFPTTLHYRHVVVIPAYRETAEFVTQLRASPLAQQSVLFIVVVNQPDSDNRTEENTVLWKNLQHSGCQKWRCNNLQLIYWQATNSQLLLVNRFEKHRQIPRKQGVGLARKIGADLAAHLIEQGSIQSSWIHSTDADAQLPDNYLTTLEHYCSAPASDHLYSAAVYPFRHSGKKDAIALATQLYERAINYYVQGLAWAGSPYAFHTIGSALAINAKRYCQARGFPKRAGGEDFYLLNKLAKLAPVLQPNSDPIIIRARLSDRVPFGTGPAVKKILAAKSSPYTYYHPQVFVALKAWLDALPRLWHNQNQQIVWLADLPEATQSALEHIGVGKLRRHIREQVKSPQQCLHHCHNWFDAFRTLKFIHHVQEHFYPAIPLTQAETLFAQQTRLLGKIKRLHAACQCQHYNLPSKKHC